jgi:hypothetical protein
VDIFPSLRQSGFGGGGFSWARSTQLGTLTETEVLNQLADFAKKKLGINVLPLEVIPLKQRSNNTLQSVAPWQSHELLNVLMINGNGFSKSMQICVGILCFAECNIEDKVALS